jgi:hypothetical protein
VVLLKRTLVEQRKAEIEHIETAVKDQQRKFARRVSRPPSLLEKFLQTKWGDNFEGMGVYEELPKILQATNPINNK